MDHLNDEETESYIITVHGMKSALANIGEKEWSAAAYKLEQAGKERNNAVMAGQTPAFMQALRSLITQCNPKEENSTTEISGEDREYLHEKLLSLKTACAALDKNTAKTALHALRQKTWPHTINAVLDDIAMHILHSAFREAMAATESILKIIITAGENQ